MGDKKDDDEFSIDFSRVKGFFSRGKKEPAQDKESQETGQKPKEAAEAKAEKEAKDDEIAIDFSQVKKLFSGKEKGETEQKNEEHKAAGEKRKHSESDEESISLDFSKLRGFFGKKEHEEIRHAEKSKVPEKDDDQPMSQASQGHVPTRASRL